jgi:hypothetical protein
MAKDTKFMSQIGRCVMDGEAKTRGPRPPAVDQEAYDKARDLVQAWGEEFLTIQKDFQLENFVQLYHRLREKGTCSRSF